LAALAANPTATTLSFWATKGDKSVTVILNTGFAKDMTVKLTDGDNAEVRTIESVVVDTITLTAALEHNFPIGTKFEYYEAPKVTDAPTGAPTDALTTTLTAWDSSLSSSGSNFLASSNSGSLHEGSSGSDLSGSASSGSTASGSSGSVLQMWQWVIVAILLCFCALGVAGGAAAGKKKSKKKAKKTPPAASPAPVADPVVEVPEFAPLMIDSLMPSYTGTYSAPMMYAAPLPTNAYASYASPAYAMPAAGPYAMPGTTSYAAGPAVYYQ